MTFGAGSTFGSLSPFLMNRGQAPVQRPTGPTNLAQTMASQFGQGFAGPAVTGVSMPQQQPQQQQQQQAAAVQPSAGGRIPVSSTGGGSAGLQSLFAEADKMSAQALKDYVSPSTQYNGGTFGPDGHLFYPGQTLGGHPLPEGWQIVGPVAGRGYIVTDPKANAKAKEARENFLGTGGGSTDAMNEATAFLKSLGL